MKKVFVIPLLASLPALLSGCADNPDISRYQRVGYNSYAECMAAYRTQISQGLQNPCTQNRSFVSGGYLFYGPYLFNSGRDTRYVGYDSSGQPARDGLRVNTAKGTFGSFKAAGTSRGGFTSASRSRGGGSFGG